MTSTIVTTPADDSVIIIERVFDAPRTLMFKLFTDPFHLAQFWGPHGITNPVCEIDLRPGGLWRAGDALPEWHRIRASTSVYIEIVEPERIVYRDVPLGSDGGFGRACRRRSWSPRILFEEVDGKTKLTSHIRATSHRRTRPRSADGLHRNRCRRPLNGSTPTSDAADAGATAPDCRCATKRRKCHETHQPIFPSTDAAGRPSSSTPGRWAARSSPWSAMAKRMRQRRCRQSGGTRSSTRISSSATPS